MVNGLELCIWGSLILPVVGMLVEHHHIQTINHEQWKQRQGE